MHDNQYADKAAALLSLNTLPDDNMSMYTQKIENGFLINTSGNKDGRFFQRIPFVEYEWRLGVEVERLWNDFGAKPAEPVPTPTPFSSDDDIPF